ncbi:MAG: 6,7-dimethyl-8-ribityllumazine synthase [Spirochaetia bacterium]|nr:6,7-dimethyl-8-ribityllumazine synthase [Spirochaetia bacterium]
MKADNNHEIQFEKNNFNIAIAASRYNFQITEKLVNGALDFLKIYNQNTKETEIFWVSGAFELPLLCKNIFQIKKPDGIIAIGAVIKGDTPHFEYISNQCARGIMSISLEVSKPISFGVLTTENYQQAIDRTGEKTANKGYEAAMSLWESLSLFKNNL